VLAWRCDAADSDEEEDEAAAAWVTVGSLIGQLSPELGDEPLSGAGLIGTKRRYQHASPSPRPSRLQVQPGEQQQREWSPELLPGFKKRQQQRQQQAAAAASLGLQESLPGWMRGQPPISKRQRTDADPHLSAQHAEALLQDDDDELGLNVLLDDNCPHIPDIPPCFDFDSFMSLDTLSPQQQAAISNHQWGSGQRPAALQQQHSQHQFAAKQPMLAAKQLQFPGKQPLFPGKQVLSGGGWGTLSQGGPEQLSLSHAPLAAAGVAAGAAAAAAAGEQPSQQQQQQQPPQGWSACQPLPTAQAEEQQPVQQQQATQVWQQQSPADEMEAEQQEQQLQEREQQLQEREQQPAASASTIGGLDAELLQQYAGEQRQADTVAVLMPMYAEYLTSVLADHLTNWLQRQKDEVRVHCAQHTNRSWSGWLAAQTQHLLLLPPPAEPCCCCCCCHLPLNCWLQVAFHGLPSMSVLECESLKEQERANCDR
jgi:hypothetical protein